VGGIFICQRFEFDPQIVVVACTVGRI
jgi:hypothetical protein